MRRLSPKQLEIRERERAILDIAQGMLLERGYVGLTMDRIAEAVGVSKGTIYQHFDNKEDVLAAVALRTDEIRGALFDRAASFRGLPRERVTAIAIAAEIFFRLYPNHEQAERIIKASSIAAKISDKRIQGLTATSMLCFTVATGVVRDAVAVGDLALRPPHSVDQVCIGLWNMFAGGMLMHDLAACLPAQLVDDPMPTLHANAQVLLDGFGWRPLSAEIDLAKLRTRILTEVFAHEAQALGMLDSEPRKSEGSRRTVKKSQKPRSSR